MRIYLEYQKIYKQGFIFMITWMQRHKKYLIITIWISTIAFVGAGFVGWGQYSYGDKAGAVAKVGDIEITMGELQKSYSRLYSQYNSMFKGNFDEEKAKSFGLKSQALTQLTDRALILNLAKSYNLRVSDAQLLKELQSQEYFFKDGVFNKKIYKETLSRNNLKMKEYEDDLRKSILIQKVLKLFPVEVSKNEQNIFDAVMNIADKIEYKVLTSSDITIDSSDEALKKFWETQKQNFMSEVSYELSFIKQEKIHKDYDDEKIASHYTQNKTHFKDAEGKIIPLDQAKEKVIAELDAKSTKDVALRTYIAFKKGKLSEDVKIDAITISASNNPYTQEVLQKVQKLSTNSPYLKPVKIDDKYFTFKLTKINPSVTKSFQEAKSDVLPLYLEQEQKTKLAQLAKDSLKTFSGTKTDFISKKDITQLSGISALQTNDFFIKLFDTQTKRGIITLNDGTLVLYNILEQKMLDNSSTSKSDAIMKIKSAMFNEGLIKTLRNKYQTEIFIQGL
jgi:peptidyl-prolyl cis-trans isomerase D